MTQNDIKPKTVIEEQKKVSAGKVDKIAEALINPTRDKYRDTTTINRYQASLFPLLDTLDKGWEYLVGQAEYIQLYHKAKHIQIDNKKISKNNKLTNDENEAIIDKAIRLYMKGKKIIEPLPPNLADELLVRIAQWNRSIAGSNNLANKLGELTMAQIESQGSDDSLFKETDNWDNK